MDAEAESLITESPPVVVILVGPPGSGKSTFCNEVMAAAHRPWVRICQDVIANGKAGTQSQCLMNAASALKDQKSVFIDRCNLDREQRAEFVKLGRGRADVHAVVLDLPAKLCISRSVKRTGHEGNLQGGKAAAVVNRMLQKKESPNLNEGFHRITFCQNESDVKDAVKTYSFLGPSDSLLPGIYGHKSKEAKVQLGIMKFLKKVDKPGTQIAGTNAITDGGNSQNTLSGQGFMNNTDSMGLENSNKNDKNASGSRSSHNGPCTLAFPSISTSDFQFDINKASEIIVDCVAEFLEKVDNARLVLVDLSHKSKILSLVREKSLKKNVDNSKFFTIVGDITELHTKGNLRCEVIANAANWRLKPGGGGVNAAIFRAAGEALEIATKEQADTLNPGNSVVVPLPASSPLYLKEGVTHVIHVLGPNMNPQRPDCLKNDYVEGCRVLRDAYYSLFKNFACIIKGNTKNEKNAYRTHASDDCTNLEKSREGDQKIKREGFITNESNKKCKALPPMSSDKEQFSMWQEDSEFVATSETSTSCKKYGKSPDQKMSDVMIEKCNNRGEVIKRSWNSWAQALHEIALHPEKHRSVVLEISDDFIVLNDLYPKAKRHKLVVSRLEGLDCIADVRKEHLALLKKMHSTGLKWAEELINADPSLIFRLGYHSSPSMRQLHLHVISQDFDSLHLKNKKHWNTFTTSFFRDSVTVIDEIEKHGAATINDDEKLLKTELRCHRCRSAHPNIPRLKSHITSCKSSFPSDLEHGGRLVSRSSMTRMES